MSLIRTELSIDTASSTAGSRASYGRGAEGRRMPGDDGFSASELRKRNLRGGTVADDELS